VLQSVAVCCSVLKELEKHTTEKVKAEENIAGVAVCSRVLQCVAVCRSVLQCVAVCCSVLKEL